jgi:hypothetical protein
MPPSKGYNVEYQFTKQERLKNRKKLIIIGVIFTSLILLALISTVVRTLWQKRNAENVSQVFPNAIEQETERKAYGEAQQAYRDVKIPYNDPQDRFYIEFVTPYVSDRIRVVIASDKDYDKVRSDAESIVNEAKKKVPINSVVYINNF